MGFPVLPHLPTDFQSTVNLIGVLAVVLAAGRLVQQVRTVAHLVDRVEERLDAHMLNRKIHPDAEVIERDLREAREKAEAAQLAAQAARRQSHARGD